MNISVWIRSSGRLLVLAILGLLLAIKPSKQMATDMQIQTVAYCNARRMDIYTPANPRPSMPAAIYVHGGGWTTGDRRAIGPIESRDMMNALLEQGFVIASIDYALRKSYPQNIQNVVCSIQYLRANASALNINPDRIGIWGDSAGGHLVTLAGLANQTGGFDSSAFPQISSKVQAVIDLYGPTIMATHVFGTEQANPITWISRTPDSDPPFLIVHGALDRTVPVSDSQALYNALMAKGQPATLRIVDGVDHGFFPNDVTINPSDAQITATMIDFFLQHLKPSEDQPTPGPLESSSGTPKAP